MNNARFLVLHNGDEVILTLRPGQSLSWKAFETTEEGWDLTFSEWSYRDGMLHFEQGSDGTDCDGRLRTFVVLVAVVPASGAMPHWDEVDSGRQDFAAEAAGY